MCIRDRTMTTDSGSSRSQSEVHERVANKYTLSDLRLIENTVNNKLIPLMVYHGLLSDGTRFEWDKSEQLDLMQRWEIDKELIKSFEVPQEYIEQTYGTPVGEPKTAQPFSNFAKLQAIYKDA